MWKSLSSENQSASLALQNRPCDQTIQIVNMLYPKHSLRCRDSYGVAQESPSNVPDSVCSAEGCLELSDCEVLSTKLL